MSELFLKHWKQEALQIGQHKALWLAPLGFGGLLVVLVGLLFGQQGALSPEWVILMLPLLWLLVIIQVVSQGLPLFTEEAWLSVASFSALGFERLYRRQWALLTGVLVLGLWVLGIAVVLFLQQPWLLIGLQLPLLMCVVGSLILLGHIVQSLVGHTQASGLLLSLLVLPLYIPVLLLSAMALQAGLQGLSMRPYEALLLAFGLLLWGIGPLLLKASVKIRL